MRIYYANNKRDLRVCFTKLRDDDVYRHDIRERDVVPSSFCEM